MPRSVQHVEQEPVQDGSLAPGAVGHHVAALEDTECRPSHAGTTARTGATRFYAEQRLDSGTGDKAGANVPSVSYSEPHLPLKGKLTIPEVAVVPVPSVVALVRIQNPEERRMDLKRAYSCLHGWTT